MSRGRLELGALGAFAVGSLLIVVVDHWLARTVGVLALFAFIAAGVFALASPALLDGDEEDGP